MKDISINADEERTGELGSLLDKSRSQVQALKNEVCELKKANTGLGKRLDILRRWALRNIHLRNEMMQNSSSPEEPVYNKHSTRTKN